MKYAFVLMVLFVIPFAYAQQIDVGQNKPPNTIIAAIQVYGTDPLEVDFISVCKDADGNISSCVIDFGEGINETLFNIETSQGRLYIYKNPGTFTATLYATDNEGAVDDTPATKVIRVKNNSVHNTTDSCYYDGLCENSDIICPDGYIAECYNVCRTQTTSGVKQSVCTICTPDCSEHGVEESLCGNGVLDLGEECDTVNVRELTCENFGYNSGVLVCNNCKFGIDNCLNRNFIVENDVNMIFILIMVIPGLLFVAFLVHEKSIERKIAKMVEKARE